MTTKRTSGGFQPDPVRLSTPTDLIAILPYLLGFHPTDSIVVVALRGKNPVLNVRLDLPAAGCPADELRDLVAQLIKVLVAHAATGALVVGYGTAERATPVVRALLPALAGHRIAVPEALRVADGHYWSYLCSDQECCPAQGSPYDVSTSAIAAAATVAGLVALPDRQALLRQVGPVGGLSRLGMRQATIRADRRLAEMVTARGDAEAAAVSVCDAGERALAGALARHRDGGRLTDDEAAWLSLLVSMIPVRDDAWRQIMEGTEMVETHHDLWLDIMRRAEPDLVAAPGCLLAFCAWEAGNGALASAALDRVLRLEPDYSMADLIARGLATGVPPSELAARPARSVRSRSARRRRRRSSSRRAGTPRG